MYDGVVQFSRFSMDKTSLVDCTPVFLSSHETMHGHGVPGQTLLDPFISTHHFLVFVYTAVFIFSN